MCQYIPFGYFQPPWKDEEADWLGPIGDVQCRTENTPERLFGRSCLRRRLFTFVSLAKAATAPPRKWRRLRFWNRRGKLTARAPRFIYVKVLYWRRIKTRNRWAANNHPYALALSLSSARDPSRFVETEDYMCYQYVCIVRGLFYITAGVVLRSDIWLNRRQRSVCCYYKLPQVGT